MDADRRGDQAWVVVGGAGFLGGAIVRHLADTADVTVVDPRPPRPGSGAAWVGLDLLLDDHVDLPPGRVVLAHGLSQPRPRRLWTLPYVNALSTARLASCLQGRDVVLLSSVEVYGWAPGPLTEATRPRLPMTADRVASWCDAAARLAMSACPPEAAERLCRALSDADPTGRWCYGLSKAAQEILLRRVVGKGRLTVLRLANVFGLGQQRVVDRIVRAVLADRPVTLPSGVVRSFLSVRDVATMVERAPAGTWNASSGQLALIEVADLVMDELGIRVPVATVPAPVRDSCGTVDGTPLLRAIGLAPDVADDMRSYVRRLLDDGGPLFDPPLPVVVPPAPEQLAGVMRRISRSLCSGELKAGPIAAELAARLADRCGIDESRRVVLTNSGTNALRLGLQATVGQAAPGDVAVLPSFTFAATAEVLRQFGYTLRFADVDEDTWTIDPAGLPRLLADGRAKLVLAVDALGNPCAYDQLAAVCVNAGVPLLADSAPALGARHGGRPVGTQAAAHGFSFSFAKVVSGGGSGGFAVVPADADLEGVCNWLRSAWMTEVSAAVALDLVDHLDELVRRRAAVADVYAHSAADRDDLVPQAVRPGDTHAWVHWVLRCRDPLDRGRVAAELLRLGVATKPYYWPLAHRAGFEPSVPLPVTDAVGPETLALPMSSELTTEDAERVAMALDVATGRTRRPVHSLDLGPPVRALSLHPPLINHLERMT